MKREKYKVEEPYKLSSWERIAKAEINRWFTDEVYKKEITENTLKNESIGPFTKFLYHFAHLCECGTCIVTGKQIGRAHV